MNKPIIGYLIILLMKILCYAGNPQYITYNAHGGVWSLMQQDSLIWAGCNGGLARINLKNDNTDFFTTCNSGLIGNHVYDLALDSANNLWIASDYGITCYNGITWQSWTRQDVGVPQFSDVVFCVVSVDQKGRIWTGTGDIAYVACWDGAHWSTLETGEPFSSSEAIRNIWFDKNGNTYLQATWGLGIMDSVGFNIDTIITDWSNLSKDNQGNYWVFADSALIKLDGIIGIPIDTIHHVYSYTTLIKNIISDSKGTIYIGTKSGLGMYKQDSWYTYTTTNSGLPGEDICSMLSDSSEGLWIGTYEDGLVRFYNGNWKQYPIGNSPLILSYFSSFCIDSQERVWIAENEMLYCICRGVWSTYNAREGEKPGTEFNVLYEGANWKIWTDSAAAIILTDSLKWEVYTIGDYGQGSKFKMDLNGVFWYATDNGLWRYDGEQETMYTEVNTPLQSRIIKKLAIDNKNSIWLSTLPTYKCIDSTCINMINMNGGLYTFDGTNWNAIHMFVMTTQSLLWASGIEIDKQGNVWYSIMDRLHIGRQYGGGITKIDTSGVSTTFTVDNSALPSNSVVDLALDQNGGIWAGSYAGGLTFFIPDSFWYTYAQDNSPLPGNNVEQIEIDRQGNKWAKVQFEGITVFNENGVTWTGMHRPLNTTAKIDGDKPIITYVIKNNLVVRVIKEGYYAIKLFNISCSICCDYGNRYFCAGEYSLGFENKKHLENGIYFVQVYNSSDFSDTRKCIIFK